MVTAAVVASLQQFVSSIVPVQIRAIDADLKTLRLKLDKVIGCFYCYPWVDTH